MALIGYARVNRSCDLDKLDEQISLLRDEGCSAVYTDIASGMDKSRAGLAKALAALQPGDILVVKNESRLSRDWEHKNSIFHDVVAGKSGFKLLLENIYVEAGDYPYSFACGRFNEQMARHLSLRNKGKLASTHESAA